MVFSSAIFIFAFLPAVVLLSRLSANISFRNTVLAAASIVFYAFGQLQYVPLFLGSVVINYISGVLLMKNSGPRKLIVGISMLLNLGILCVFKYTDFILANLNSAFGSALPMTGIVLPIGISFFTFQGMSYVIDTYREPENGSSSFLKILLYISFFPQLIAGPIVKYHDVALQIDSRVCTPEETAGGIRRFLRGLGKKVLISNAVGYITDTVFSSGLGFGDIRLMWLAAVSYSLQIYFDFSGYSDMAIGLGHMFGFTFLENFNFPYSAFSIRDFWRRWHMSLSSWFREYLYFPLGGSRRGRVRAALNRFIVFFCTGIWHGANWTFVVWGLGHGLLSSLEGSGIIPVEKLRRSLPGRILCRVYTMFSVILLFVIFRAETLAGGLTVIRGMFAGSVTAEGSVMLGTLLTPAACFIIILGILLSGGLVPALRSRFAGSALCSSMALRVLGDILLLAVGLLSIMSLSLGGYNPFIYFQF